MEFIGAGDIHLTSRTPRNRTDLYYTHMLDKFEEIIDLTEKVDSKTLVVAGDFFDDPEEPYQLTNTIMEILIPAKINILVVPGQHDLRYHASGLKDTPLGTLREARLVSILLPCHAEKIDGVSFVGQGWNDEIPTMKGDVLVTHQMVTHKEGLWPGHKGFKTAKQMLKKYKWAKCILSGDNHAPHSVKSKGRIQINTGSMMRSTKAQMDHRPCVWNINSDDWSYKKVYLKSAHKAEDVFDIAKIEREELIEMANNEASEEMEDFINSLKMDKKKKPKFKNILNKVIKETNPNKGTINLINEIMEDVSGSSQN